MADDKKQKRSIHIGEYFASRQPTIVHTLLGSCVAVCLYDVHTRVGGMNHIFLPGEADMKHFDAPARFGVNAMELLINRIMNLGGLRHHLAAKIFGGAHMLPSVSIENGTGKKILEFVFEFLENESIKIVNQDIGGTITRRVYFHTDSGAVFLKRIHSRYFPDQTVEAMKRIRRIRKKAEGPSEINLFNEINQLLNSKS